MKRLGRGLSAILEDAEAGYLKDLEKKGFNEIEIEKIIPNPYQPRKEFKEEAIDELARSIKKYGLLQPVIVIKDDDRYILVAGERRIRALKKLKQEKVKAYIADFKLEDLREYALIENIQRENLNSYEIALSLYELIKKHGYTHEELATILSKSRSYVTNMLRLLKLPEEVIELIREDKLSFGHAKILVGLERDDAIEISKKIIKDNLSVREAERLVRELKNKEEKKELQKVAHKLQNYGFKVEYNKNFIKIIFKNEDDIKKLEELLKIDNT